MVFSYSNNTPNKELNIVRFWGKTVQWFTFSGHRVLDTLNKCGSNVSKVLKFYFLKFVWSPFSSSSPGKSLLSILSLQADRDMDREGNEMHRENVEVSFINSPALYLSLGEISSKRLGKNNDLRDKNAIEGTTRGGDDGRERRGKGISGMVKRGTPKKAPLGLPSDKETDGVGHRKPSTSCLGSSDFWVVSLPSSSRE